MNNLTPAELAAMTIRDIKRRQEQREKGIKDADQYGYEMRAKSSKRMNKIRSKNYRGR